MDDRTKAKIAIIVTPIVLLLVFLINKVDSAKCDPVRENTAAGLARLFTKKSITKIVVKNGREPFDTELDSLVSTDADVLEEIRTLILDRGYIPLNRYSPKWEIEMLITVDTGTRFNLGLKKSDDDDEGDTGFKIYFDEQCDGNYRYGSKDLGHRIMELIQSR